MIAGRRAGLWSSVVGILLAGSDVTAQTAVARGAAGVETSRSAPRALAEEAAGAAAAQQGVYDAAEGHFRAAIRIDPQLESAYLNLGRLYQEHANEHPGAARKALATYRALLKVAPSNTEGLYQAGYLAACAGEWSSSRAWLERLPADARSRPQVLAVLAIDLAALAEPRRASETAMALLAHPDLTEADVLAAGPALDRANNAALEEQLLAGLEARGLASAASLRRLGAVEVRLGRLEAARAALERAAAASPAPSVPLLLDLARVAYKQKDYEGVLGYLARARELEPDNAEVHFFFGIASIELNLGSEAYDALKKAVALSPDNPYVNYALGAVAIHRHEPSEALPYFEAYVRLKPDDPRGRFALGAAKFYSHDLTGARADLTRAAQVPETAAGAHYFLARIARQSDQLDAAVLEIRRSLEARPQYPDALAELGLLQTRRGEYAEAERSLTQALTLEPDNYAATVNLATLYARTRDPRREAQAVRLAELQRKREDAAQEFLRIVEIVK